MAKEIERKFLVTDRGALPLNMPHKDIRQAYLNVSPDATVRLRVAGNRAFITVKNRNKGAERDEWEYEIPKSDAADIMDRCECTGEIAKTRYVDGRWEIDVFHGRHEGLIMAEIEMTNPDEPVTLPPYIGREVTDDPRYYNSSLATAEDLPPFE